MDEVVETASEKEWKSKDANVDQELGAIVSDILHEGSERH